MYGSELGDFAELFSRLSENGKASLHNADMVARNNGSVYIGTEHLLVGILLQTDSIGSKILTSRGVDVKKAQALVAANGGLSVGAGMGKGLSETAKLTIKMAWDIAQEFGQNYFGTEHLLYSLLTQKNARGTQLLLDLNIDTNSVADEIDAYLSRNMGSSQTEAQKTRKKKTTALDIYGTDLTDNARKGELDPVVGRDDQIRRLITILGRRTKNNPVLIGEPGVGRRPLWRVLLSA